MVDGAIKLLPYHQTRLERTLAHCCPGTRSFSLSEVLADRPTSPGVVKIRVVYGAEGVTEVGYAPYAVRHIRRLQLVADDTIDYTYKSTDRSHLVALALQKDEADEVIIVKNGLLTDTSYSNIALYDGSGWFTPRLPLLRGTMRQYLLDQGRLREADIRPEDLAGFQKVALINAMMPLGVCEVEI